MRTIPARDLDASIDAAEAASPFDDPATYDEALNQGLRLSGEEKHFFIDGRLVDLQGQLPRGWKPRRILDFGCGTGDTTVALRRLFPSSEVVGADAARPVIDAARATHAAAGVTFRMVDSITTSDRFDLCYVNGVFHHIPPEERAASAALILNALAADGRLALFENNPWNLGTRMVMKRLPFDRDAQMLSVFELRRLLLAAGFRSCSPGRFLFYFPSSLRALRALEPGLARLPLGAQYWVLAVK